MAGGGMCGRRASMAEGHAWLGGGMCGGERVISDRGHETNKGYIFFKVMYSLNRTPLKATTCH